MSNEEKRAKVIAFTFQKGGFGKTTISVNLASILAWKGYSVLLVDGDRHCTASHFLNVHDETKYGIYDVITGRCSFDDAIQMVSFERAEGSPKRKDYDGFEMYAVPSYDNLGKSEEDIKERADWQLVLRKAINQSNAISHFDYIIIDCPPESDIFLPVMYNAAEYFVFPVFPESHALDNMSITYEQLYILSNPSFPKTVLGCVINNYKKTEISDFFVSELKSLDYARFFNTVIPRYEGCNVLNVLHTPIITYYKELQRAKKFFNSFESFANEIILATTQD